MAGEQVEDLPPGLTNALRRATAYPHDPSSIRGVREVQTHLSHVYLTGERVYKLRKAVNLGFVDFRTRAQRNADCLRELELNRRLAPDVYLGVAPIELYEGRLQVGPTSEKLSDSIEADEVLEHCVVMRRLPEGRDALSLLERGQLRDRHLDRVARRLARFHEEQRLGVPSPYSSRDWLASISAPVEANLELLETRSGNLLSRATLERLTRRVRSFFAEHADRFEARRRNGHAVDGHGDLHLQHVWFETDDAEPLLIDCIEFGAPLRRIDAASDAAFLAMDLIYRGRRKLAEFFLRRYARESDDFDLYAVVDYYVSYRAAVRAKVATIAALDTGISQVQRAAAAESARRHLRLAARTLGPPRRSGLVILSGIVGTGKTSVAEQLGDELNGVVISSDRVRKSLAGLKPTDRMRGMFREGIYAPQLTEDVYQGLLDRAEPVVASGRFAILDATFARSRQRRAARLWARSRSLPFRIVETRCAETEVLRRLAKREAQGNDPSDAGPALYRPSAAGFESLLEASPEEHRLIHTDHRTWRGSVRELTKELRGARRD